MCSRKVTGAIPMCLSCVSCPQPPLPEPSQRAAEFQPVVCVFAFRGCPVFIPFARSHLQLAGSAGVTTAGRQLLSVVRQQDHAILHCCTSAGSDTNKQDSSTCLSVLYPRYASNTCLFCRVKNQPRDIGTYSGCAVAAQFSIFYIQFYR